MEVMINRSIVHGPIVHLLFDDKLRFFVQVQIIKEYIGTLHQPGVFSSLIHLVSPPAIYAWWLFRQLVRMWIMQQEKVAGGDAPHLIIQLEDIEVSVVRSINSENRPVDFLQLGKGRTFMLANPRDPFTIGF